MSDAQSDVETHAPQSFDQEGQEGFTNEEVTVDQMESCRTSSEPEPSACGLMVCCRHACCCGKQVRSGYQGGA